MNLYKPKLKSQRDNQLGKSQRDKPKFKPKLFKRLIALTLAIATMLTALPVTALAESMTFEGAGAGAKSTPAKDGKHTYGLHYTTAIASWRVTLYVSTSDDGKIDPLTDSINGTGLGKVGTIFYNSIFEQYGESYIPADVFVQATANTENRTATFSRELPAVSQIKSDHKVIPGSEAYGDKIYIRPGSEVRDWLYRVGPYDNAASGDPEFTERVIEDMNISLGGSEDNFYPLYAKIAQVGACKTGTEAGDKLDAAINEKGAIEGYMTLLPTNDDCVVEWCLVVEPISEYTTIYQPSFWDCTLYDDFWESWEQVFIGLGVTATIGLDAYAVAQYNEKSKVAYTYDSILETIKRNIPDFQATGVVAGDNKYYDQGGKLIAEYGTSNINNAASMNYDCHTECNPYCGVPVAGSAVGFSYTTNPQYTATYGGISVYTTDKDTAQIPVYYYIYDENNNFLRKETDSYTLYKRENICYTKYRSNNKIKY